MSIEDDMHLSFRRGRFCWAWKRKQWWHSLLPHWLQDVIAHVGNVALCRLFGHDYTQVHLAKAGHIPPDAARCVNCSKRLELRVP